MLPDNAQITCAVIATTVARRMSVQQCWLVLIPRDCTHSRKQALTGTYVKLRDASKSRYFSRNHLLQLAATSCCHAQPVRLRRNMRPTRQRLSRRPYRFKEARDLALQPVALLRQRLR